MPHPTRRRWIKLWTQESLYGSISQELEPAERWAWIGLLLMAGDSMSNGMVSIAPGVPYTDEQIAKILALPLNDWQAAKAKMVQVNKIEVNGTGIIKIVKWDEYQGFDRLGYQREYMRGVRQNVRQPVSLTNTLTDTTTDPVRQNVRLNVRLQEEEGRGGEGKDTLSNKDMSTVNKVVSRKKRAAPPDSRVKEILDAVVQFLGKPDKDPIPNWGAEGSHVKRMLQRGFTPGEILTFWKVKITEQGKYVGAHWVNTDIGRKDKATDRRPPGGQYHKPEEVFGSE